MKKTYWQAMDGDGKAYLFYGYDKPTCDDGEYYSDNNGNYSCDILFPIELKPLQIATITVNENGTWSWEIEREEGWYFAEWKKDSKSGGEGKTVINYSDGIWRWLNTMMIMHSDIEKLTISPTRIPDECII